MLPLPFVFKKISKILFTTLLFIGTFSLPLCSNAATLSVSPGTGVYKTGATFSVTILVNTAGTPVNAADGTLAYNPKELSVVSVSRGASIFNLWTTEPTFSNAAGTVTFSGGVPTGYTGASGNVFVVTFRALSSGTARVSLTGASVLAADGKGTNVLTNMNGGTYTFSAVESQPAPEVIVEYVAPANTPATPQINSTTHAKDAWSKEKTAILSWSVPSGVIAVRTGLDKSPIAVPTKVYDSPLRTLTIPNLDEGVSYLHVQFKNADGWGKVGHYKLAVDSEKPESFEIKSSEGSDFSNPTQTLVFTIKDKTSPVSLFKVQINGGEPYEVKATSSPLQVILPTLEPGYHTVVAEGFDASGNSLLASYSFTITSFEKPLITEFPVTLNAGTVPVIRGTTKSLAKVIATITPPSGEFIELETTANEAGIFSIIPDEDFKTGVYRVTVIATDQFGARSERSDEIKIIVSEPGYVAVGNFLISFLSLLIPLIALCVLTWLTLLYCIAKMRRTKKAVVVESEEAAMMLATEFRHIEQVIVEQEELMKKSRKTNRLTLGEEKLFTELRLAIKDAKQRVGKEVDDVTHLFKK